MKKLNLNFRNNERPKRGSILISDPLLNDQYFSRSVVLLCEHNQEGSFGFVLNNYLEIDLHRIDNNFPDIQARISIGGPVHRENLFFIHSFDAGTIPESVQVAEGIFYGGDFDILATLLRDFPETRNKARFFVGYSGWSIGQLNEEIDEKSWITVSNIPKDLVFDTQNDNLWKTCLEMQGDSFKLFTTFPRNPQDN